MVLDLFKYPLSVQSCVRPARFPSDSSCFPDDGEEGNKSNIEKKVNI